MLFHGSCYSPKDAPWPGWYFYASTKMDWRNAIWRDVPALSDYIARCQSVLQSGQPAPTCCSTGRSSICGWTPRDHDPLTVHRHDWMAGERIGAVADLLLAKGFAFDFVSDQMIETLGVDNGKPAAPGGTYRAIVVPACKYMPETTLQRLADLAQRDVPVVLNRHCLPTCPALPS